MSEIMPIIIDSKVGIRIVKCPNGHTYNADVWEYCPFCKRKS